MDIWKFHRQELYHTPAPKMMRQLLSSIVRPWTACCFSTSTLSILLHLRICLWYSWTICDTGVCVFRNVVAHAHFSTLYMIVFCQLRPLRRGMHGRFLSIRKIKRCAYTDNPAPNYFLHMDSALSSMYIYTEIHSCDTKTIIGGKIATRAKATHTCCALASVLQICFGITCMYAYW